MYKLLVSWNREASNIIEEAGNYSDAVKALEEAEAKLSESDEPLVWDIKEFATEAELIAYEAGVNDANGWDNPMCLTKNSSETA